MTRTSRTRRYLALPFALALGAGFVLAGCGSDDDGAADTTTTEASGATTTEAPTEPAASAIGVGSPWARTSPSMATAGAVYMSINNASDVDDALVGVSVDSSVARTAELHETSMAGDDDMDDDMDDGDDMDDVGDMDDDGMDDDGGMMTMQQVDEIPIAAGATVELEPGGYHVMLLDLVEPLEVGDFVEITLTFEKGPEIVVQAEVRDTAP